MIDSIILFFQKKILPALVLSVVIVGGFTWWVGFTIDSEAGEYMLGFEEVIGQHDTAIVLGAKVYANGALGAIVRDRADMAIRLYKSGKVKKILASADNKDRNYNETKAIYDYLIDNGVAKVDIFVDFAGFDTYDSVYRAKHNFLVEKLLIPNHINYCPRSLYLARHLGMDARCVTMPKRFKPRTLGGYYRETLAKVKARTDVTFSSKAYFASKDTYPIGGTGNAGMFY
ncbi:MAG: ElyC/SanA/YdcF family protein [Candidatus Absconditabacterales bacterium]